MRPYYHYSWGRNFSNLTCCKLVEMSNIILHFSPTWHFKFKFAKLRLRRIWSRTHLIPGLPIPHFLSPWINDPLKIDPPGQTVPIKFGPSGQMVPKNLVPLDKWSLEYSVCPGGQAVGIQKYGDQIIGDHLSIGTEFDGDRLSRGINFMGIVCPGGQEVGDRKSGDQMGSGPNVSQPCDL